jgi:hypothetical protein
MYQTVYGKRDIIPTNPLYKDQTYIHSREKRVFIVTATKWYIAFGLSLSSINFYTDQTGCGWTDGLTDRPTKTPSMYIQTTVQSTG